MYFGWNKVYFGVYSVYSWRFLKIWNFDTLFLSDLGVFLTLWLGGSDRVFEKLGVSQRPLTLIFLQKHRDTNGRRIVIQSGGVYTAFCQEEDILLQKYRDRNGRCIAILFKSIGVMGRLFWRKASHLNLERLILHPLQAAMLHCNWAPSCFTASGQPIHTERLKMQRTHSCLNFLEAQQR